MDREALTEFINARLKSGPKDNKGDVALKLYFYDVASALIEKDVLDSFFKPDGITIRKGRRNDFMEAVIPAFGEFARQLCGPEDHLTILLYGIVLGKGRFPLDLHISADDKVFSAGRLKTYRRFRRGLTP